LSRNELARTLRFPLRVDFPNRLILHFDFDVIDLARMNADRYLKLANLAAPALAALRPSDERSAI
jgi:hypothetical protein